MQHGADPAPLTQCLLKTVEKQSEDRPPTLITRRGKTEKSVFGFRAARCCNREVCESARLETNFEFSSDLRSRIGSPAKSFEGGR